MARRYRGQDVWRWLEALGDLEQRRDDIPDESAPPRSLTVTGANGGEQLDLDVLDRLGVTLTGRLERFDGSVARVADDLGANVADAERRMERVLDRIDARFPDWPHEPDRPGRVSLPGPPRAAISSARESPTSSGRRATAARIRGSMSTCSTQTARSSSATGSTRVAGLYVLGRNFQSRRSSHFIGGVGRDAAFIASLL